MRVNKIMVPAASISAARDAMGGSFTTQDVTDAVRSINEDIGVDVGEHTSEEFARLVAERLIRKAVDAGTAWPTGDDAFQA